MSKLEISSTCRKSDKEDSEDSLSSSTRQTLSAAGRDDDDEEDGENNHETDDMNGTNDDNEDEYMVKMETYTMEMIDPTIHYLTDILQDDFYKTYKHEKMMDIPADFIDRFHYLRHEINAMTNRKELHFKRLKIMIANRFPRGKKDTKTKERVDEVIARVYTEATRRMMRLMLDEGDTSILKIDPERFVLSHPEFASLRQAKPDEFKNIQLFYRAIYIAHRIIGIPCQGFRNHFMRIGTLLENSGIYYATGGRPAKTTMARKEMIDQLTQCSRTKRSTKKASPSPSVAGNNSGGDNFTGLAALLVAAGDDLAGMVHCEPFTMEYQNMDAMNEIVDNTRKQEQLDLTNMCSSAKTLGIHEAVDHTDLLAKDVNIKIEQIL